MEKKRKQTENLHTNETQEKETKLVHSPLDEYTENRISESVSEGMVQGDIDGI